MREGKERSRHPFVTAAWATGGVLACLMGVLLAVWSYEGLRDAVETARRERAARHWPGAISLCSGLLESQARHHFGFGSTTANEAREEARELRSRYLATDKDPWRLSPSDLGRYFSLERELLAIEMALKRWDELSGEGFQLQDVEALGGSGLVRFSGVGTGFAVAKEGVEYVRGVGLDSFAVRERAYGFAFTYDTNDPRCLELLLVVDGK